MVGGTCVDTADVPGVETHVDLDLDMFSQIGFQTTPSFLFAGVITLGGLLNGPGLDAQTVRGYLFEAESGRPVPAGAVMLLDTTHAPVVSTTSNAFGAFSVTASEPGDYLLLVQAMGYAPVIDGVYELGEGGVISLELHLRPNPLALDSLVVSVRQAVSEARLQGSGFDLRKRTGFGYFLTPEEIKERDPQFLWDLFQGIPGLFNVSSLGAGTQLAFFRPRLGSIYCSPSVYVDGVKAHTAAGGLETVVGPRNVLAMEVYTRASSVPLQFGGTTADGCGVVLIWTK